MRLVTTLSLTAFFTLFYLAVLSAQGPWTPTPVPQGDYIEDEFIIYFDPANGFYPNNTFLLDQAFSVDHGLEVKSEQLDQAGSYFLVRLINNPNPTIGAPRKSFCNRSAPSPLPCTLCEVLSNPGSGGPMSRGDDDSPNYIGDSGLAYESNLHEEYSYDDLFGTNGFDPLVGTPSGDANEEGNESGEDCYAGNTLPFGTNQQRGQLQVAILDSGVSTVNYGDFFNYQINGEDQSMVNWVPIPPNVLDFYNSQVNYDPNGHGTAVSFLVAHDFVNQQAPERIKLNSYRILNHAGKGTLAGLIWSLDHAINNNMDIVNMSFGFRETDCYEESAEDAKMILAPLFADAEAQDVLIFTSAGNDNADLSISENQQWPAAYNTFDNLFTVGADGCTPGDKWKESNYHADFVDLMAPGLLIAMPYTGTVTPGEYILASGTSFATPLTTAVAASYFAHGGPQGAMCALKTAVSSSSEDGINAPNARFGSIFDATEGRCLNATESDGSLRNNLLTPRISQRNSAVFPNPFDHQLTVQTMLSNEAAARIRILDSNGRLMAEHHSTSDQSTINTSTMAPGIYFLEVVDANGSRVKRIIKK